MLARLAEKGGTGMNDADFMVAAVCKDIIAASECDATKSEVAYFRKKRVCAKSKIGAYYCSVNVPFGTRFTCDFCLEAELFDLWKQGIITVGSCCGHGQKHGFIQVIGGESVKKMHELGYKQIPVDKHGYGKNCFLPKTFFGSEGGGEDG